MFFFCSCKNLRINDEFLYTLIVKLVKNVQIEGGETVIHPVHLRNYFEYCSKITEHCVQILRIGFYQIIAICSNNSQ